MVKGAYSILRIQDTLDCLQGAVWFPFVDLKNGYWQVESEEASKAFTAFTVGPFRFYECEWMPFGLMNTFATFQYLMEMCLGNLQFWWCIIYLDDIISFAATPKEHLERLWVVLSWLLVARLKLQPTKCEFFKVTVVYIGHEISREGIQTDGHKIKAIKNCSIPIMVTELRTLLGFTNYYRWFIKGYFQQWCSS